VAAKVRKKEQKSNAVNGSKKVKSSIAGVKTIEIYKYKNAKMQP
jgi:hypothetical protein